MFVCFLVLRVFVLFSYFAVLLIQHLAEEQGRGRRAAARPDAHDQHLRPYNILLCVSLSLSIYIYIEREGGRYVYVYIYIYIYTYIYIYIHVSLCYIIYVTYGPLHRERQAQAPRARHEVEAGRVPPPHGACEGPQRG